MTNLEKKFSQWYDWAHRANIPNITDSGIYCIALSETNLNKKKFKYIKSIVYIGMSNSQRGVLQRLNQFDKVFSGKGTKHCGANKLINEFPSTPRPFKIFVSVYTMNIPFKAKRTPKALKQMGKIPHLEYIALGEYKTVHNAIPKYNKK